MKKFLFIFFIALLFAQENNATLDLNKSDKKDKNASKNLSDLEKNIQKEIEKEKKYKKEQKFYMGKDYNLSEHKVDPKVLDKINIIEPDYDFEMLEF